MILPKLLSIVFLSVYFIGIGICIYYLMKGDMDVLVYIIGFNIWVFFASKIVKDVKKELTISTSGGKGNQA